jgi:hypothetical protein
VTPDEPKDSMTPPPELSGYLASGDKHKDLEAALMPDFRGHLFAGPRDLGEVSGSYTEPDDGRLSGSLYIPDTIHILDVMRRGDLCLELGGGRTLRITIHGVIVPGGRGLIVEFASVGPPCTDSDRRSSRDEGLSPKCRDPAESGGQ